MHIIDTYLLRHTDYVRSVAAMDGGRLVSVGGDGLVCVWDMASGELISEPFQVGELTGGNLDIFALAVHDNVVAVVPNASK